MRFIDRLRGRARMANASAPDAEPSDEAAAAAPFAAAVAARGQRVVFVDWVGVWTITPSGAVYFAERVDLADQVPVTAPREVNMARFRAAERYLELAHLRPSRGADDPTCPHCAGRGRVSLPDGVEDRGNIWCWCGGVGWLPAGTPLAPAHDAT